MTSLPSITTRVEDLILEIRGIRVLLDSELASLYGVTTGALIHAVERNLERFPEDFMFQLTREEHGVLISQFVISKPHGRGGRRTPPYAFTEQGVAMLSSVLRSPMAAQVNVSIMRAFVRLRRYALSHDELAQRLDILERSFDQKFRIVFEAIEAMLEDGEPESAPLGFKLDRT